ncbi:AraC-type DNA-binding protein [Clostridium cavendishii DSM 21758]|uniref:AraC-type DNA-binding protein n=1 Tax=Clostridium cavendishii DSM 21758 TaxID=1121302 RepID=A0A1M6DH79_9CLOT|nr:AraC family transcriptional regulator [Clostridium cavendishii]SHI72704.1 AraC-type DNA-binding protein [Clostridium cavendishii DSM 21758]
MSQYEYKLNNKKSNGVSICQAFNEAYNSESREFNYIVPNEIGIGEIKRINCSKGVKIIDYKLNFIEPIEIFGVSRTPHIDMIFCLGDDINWEIAGTTEEFKLFSDQTYIGTSCETRKNTIYPAKTNLHLVEIKIPLLKVNDIIESTYISNDLNYKSLEHKIYGKYKITSSIQVILQQIFTCPYENIIKNIFIEGKILELVAIYLNEAIYQKEKIPGKISLSTEDLESIYKAKTILDCDISQNISISSISKCVYLNEYKLKKGFKEVYGAPIHTYVINKRLETAKTLLEKDTLTVSEVSLKVGYSNMSHFAAAFRKKYGVNPKEYINDIRE